MNKLLRLSLSIITLFSVGMSSSYAYDINETMRNKAAIGGLNLDKMMLNNGNDVIVHYNTPDVTVSASKISNDSLARDETRFKNVKASAISKDTSKVVHLRDYLYSPVTYTRFYDNQALLDALNNPNVAYITANHKYKASDVSSNLSLIGQPSMINSNYTGKGTIVAVLDTGTDYTRNAFGNCTATALGSDSCKVLSFTKLVPSEIQAGDTTLDNQTGSGAYHGTNVSGTVVSVAPDTKLAVYDVFNGDSASDSDIYAAYNNIKPNVPRSDGRKFAAINMSLGLADPTTITTACNNPAYTSMSSISTMKQLNLATVIASGNDGYIDKIDYPACSKDAISVGAVYDGSLVGKYSSVAYGGGTCTDTNFAADRPTCFSNSNSNLTLLAPGSNITSAGITESGTSQAAPHVAGALAILKDNAVLPNATVDQLTSILTSTGKPITDSRNNIVTPRLDLANALSKINNECLRQGKNWTESLNTNDVLCTGDNLSSFAGNYTLSMQNDGNLVIYDNQNSHQPKWSTNTANTGTNNRAVIQTDGNFVIYTNNYAPVYATGTDNGQSGNYNITMQNDGNLVIYKFNKLWSSTNNISDNSFIPSVLLKPNQTLKDNDFLLSKNNNYRFVMQPDGNAVVYSNTGSPLYSTNTAGKGNLHNLAMQGDGNFVLYADNIPVFQTSTAGNGSSILNFNNNGELSVMKPSPIWSIFSGKIQ